MTSTPAIGQISPRHWARADRRQTRVLARGRLRRQIVGGLMLATAGTGLVLSASMAPASAAGLLGSDGAVCGVTGGLLGGALSGVGTAVLGCADAAVTPAPTPTPTDSAGPTVQPASDASPTVSPSPSPQPVVTDQVPNPTPVANVPSPSPAPAPAPAPFALQIVQPTSTGGTTPVSGAGSPAGAVAEVATANAANAAATDVSATSHLFEPDHTGAARPSTTHDSRSTTHAKTDSELVAVSPLPNGDDLSGARRAFGVGLLVAGIALVGLGAIGTVRRRQLTLSVANVSTNVFSGTPWAGGSGA